MFENILIFVAGLSVGVLGLFAIAWVWDKRDKREWFETNLDRRKVVRIQGDYILIQDQYLWVNMYNGKQRWKNSTKGPYLVDAAEAERQGIEPRIFI